MPEPATPDPEDAAASSPWFSPTSTRAWLLAPLCCALAVGFYWIVDVPRSPMEGVDSPTAKPKAKSAKTRSAKKKNTSPSRDTARAAEDKSGEKSGELKP